MADQRLLRYVERGEMIREEIAERNQDFRDLLAELKAAGYDPATYRKLLARRGMSPAERGEADALLDTYEAALGMEAGYTAARRLEAGELAALLLADQVEGLGDPARAEALTGHVLAQLDLLSEIDALRGLVNARRAAAAADGFAANAQRMVVAWFRKVAKHGLAEMRLGEELFRLFRATVDEAGGVERPRGDAPTADEKLAALFAKPPRAPTQKQRAVSDAVAMARLNRRGG